MGAYDLYPGASIVVDLGTATTFDVISAKGEYLGGAIAPGVAISLEALYTHAAALRSVELVRPALGDRPLDGRVDPVRGPLRLRRAGRRRRRAHPDELGEATVIATGGLAGLIAPHTASVAARRAVAHPARIAYRSRKEPAAGDLSDDAVLVRPHRLRGRRPGALTTTWPTSEESGDAWHVAGRLMLLRRQGKLAFATMRDSTGEIQLFATRPT